MISIKQDLSVHLNKNKQCFKKDHSIIWKYAYLKNQLKTIIENFIKLSVLTNINLGLSI